MRQASPSPRPGSSAYDSASAQCRPSGSQRSCASALWCEFGQLRPAPADRAVYGRIGTFAAQIGLILAAAGAAAVDYEGAGALVTLLGCARAGAGIGMLKRSGRYRCGVCSALILMPSEQAKFEAANGKCSCASCRAWCQSAQPCRSTTHARWQGSGDRPNSLQAVESISAYRAAASAADHRAYRDSIPR